MKIEANDKELQDIFSLGYFNIPRFQRPYSWDTNEVESFWNDVIIENPENYFIGSMVVFQTKKPYFGIVDGQQRLTTITLILAAIRNAFASIGENNLAHGVHKYIEKANIDNDNEFVLKTESSFPYLQDHIQSFKSHGLNCEVGVEEKKLETAYQLINCKLNEMIPSLEDEYNPQVGLFTDHEKSIVQELKNIRDKILALKLVFIQLDSENDAYLIFETLNARGRDLTTSDLVKNLILKKLKNKSISIDQSKEAWNNILQNFDDLDNAKTIDTFLLHYWVSEHKYTTDRKLFAEVKTHISNKQDNAKQLIDTLSLVAPIYSTLLTPESHKWTKEEKDVRDSLRALNIFSVKQQTAFTLALLRAYEEGRIKLKNLKTTLKKIENFHYCFNAITSQRSSGVIASNYSSLAIQLTKAQTNDQVQKVLHDLKQFLRNKIPDKKEFVVKFSELSYMSNSTKQKSLVKYTLSRLTPQNTSGLPIDTRNSTIEHFLPESTTGGTQEDLSKSIASIGNLILLDSKTNSEEVSNKPPATKYKTLKDKGYPLSDVLLEERKWDTEAINNRTEAMASYLYKNIIDNI